MIKRIVLLVALLMPCSIFAANSWPNGPFQITDMKIIEQISDSWTIPGQVKFDGITDPSSVFSLVKKLAEAAKTAGFPITIVKQMELPTQCLYVAKCEECSFTDEIPFIATKAQALGSSSKKEESDHESYYEGEESDHESDEEDEEVTVFDPKVDLNFAL